MPLAGILGADIDINGTGNKADRKGTALLKSTYETA
jgi:hypothetical protein